MNRFTGVALLVTVLLLGSSPADAQRAAAAKSSATKSSAAKSQKIRQAKEARRYTGTSANSRANKLRLRADKISRIVGKADSNAHAQRYVSKRLHGDLANLLDSFAGLQADGRLKPSVEARSIAAVGRILHAASILDRRVIKDSQRDRVEKSMSAANYRRRAPRHDTAVEIETSLTTAIMQSITTKDPKGTIAPILEEGRLPAPDFVVEKAKTEGVQPRELAWNKLSLQQQQALIVSQSKGRDFFRDRNVPGVRFKQALPLKGLAKLSAALRKKNGNVSLDGLLERVEYMGPGAVEKLSLIHI